MGFSRGERVKGHLLRPFTLPPPAWKSRAGKLSIPCRYGLTQADNAQHLHQIKRERPVPFPFQRQRQGVTQATLAC